MKKFTLTNIFIILISLSSKAQENNVTVAAFNTIGIKGFLPAAAGSERDYDYYMHKRKRQKTIGWSLLGGGFALGGAGILLANSESNRSGNSHSSGKAAVVCFVVSAAAGLASIPFMIMASSNKRKAKLLLGKKDTGYGIPVKTGTVTGLTYTISLGR